MTAAILAGFLVTVFTSLMFSGAEQVIGSISRDSLEKMAENNVPGAGLIMHMMGSKRRFQLMLLTGKIVSITAGAVLLSGFFVRMMGSAGYSGWESMLAAFAVSTLVFLITEGVFSRVMSVGEHEAAVSRFAPFLSLFHVVF
ncbi:MAG: DUF21 domain-containing protein, partial [Candidatus Latescibacterota bacterium]